MICCSLKSFNDLDWAVKKERVEKEERKREIALAAQAAEAALAAPIVSDEADPFAGLELFLPN